MTHIIALDAVHHLFLGVGDDVHLPLRIGQGTRPLKESRVCFSPPQHFKEEFPHAKLVGPKGLVDKRKDLKFDIILPDAPLDSELSAEFRAIPLTGHPNEVRLPRRERTCAAFC